LGRDCPGGSRPWWLLLFDALLLNRRGQGNIDPFLLQLRFLAAVDIKGEDRYQKQGNGRKGNLEIEGAKEFPEESLCRLRLFPYPGHDFLLQPGRGRYLIQVLKERFHLVQIFEGLAAPSARDQVLPDFSLFFL